MDIEYLIFLQGLRGDFPGSEFVFTLVSAIPGSPLTALIPALIFWCVNKRAGLFLLFLTSFGRLVNQLVKNTACVYRPWLLDSDVHPTAKTLTDSSSYSFPSGHTNMTTTLYGGLAYLYGKKYPVLILLAVVLIFAVGFSRNFLGAHTPQDVIAAIVESVAVIFLTGKIFKIAERDDRRETEFFFAGIIICVAAGIYLMLKPYPIDYFGGQIIVTPERAKIDALDSLGGFLGFLLAWQLEKRLINFSTEIPFRRKIFRLIIGGVIGIFMLAIIALLKSFSDPAIYKFCKGFLPYMTLIFFAPLAFDFFEKKSARRSGRINFGRRR